MSARGLIYLPYFRTLPSGVSFLGAGVIFVKGRSISGLTTAAGIWATSGVGLAVGAGMYVVGVSATFLILMIQVLLHKQFRFLEGPVTEQISITMDDGDAAMQWLRKQLEEEKIQVLSLRTQRNGDGTLTLELGVKSKHQLMPMEVPDLLRGNPYLRAIEIL